MSVGGSTDHAPLCPDCGGRHEPGDHDRCELNQLQQAASGTDPVLEDDEQYDEEVS